MESLFLKPATELAKLIRRRDLSPVDLIDATLRRIEAVNPSINAFVALRADDALEEARDSFTEFDLLVTPTMPTEAFGAKGPPPAEIDGFPVNLLDAVAFTYIFNLSGHPAATVRAGMSANGLPAGLQIVGPRYRDDLVLQAAWAYEQMRPWSDVWPKL